MSKPTGAQILLLIREGKVYNWNSLCRSLGRSPTEQNSETFWIAEALQELVVAGLVEVEGNIDPPSFQFPQGEIRLTRNASVAQHALGISLPELAKLKRDHSMVIEPFFGVPEKQEKHRIDLFVLMPFHSSLKPVYEDHMLNVAKALELTIARADDLFNTKSVMSDIWESVCGAHAIIADCTGRNPNVFYEIGLAHTVGKPVILVTQNEKDVPFDLRHLRYIRYEYTPRGMKDFEEALIKTLRNELGLAEKQETNINSVLFLSSDPTDASRLRLGEEFREIQESLKKAQLREHFKLESPQLSARPGDITQALLDSQPQIVHFSGHGASTGALCFEDQTGQIQLMQPDALVALFEQFTSKVSCVLLNACYSEIQAKAIAEHIEYVIGMNKAISDRAAIAFAVGFYQALGGGRTVEEAYKLGCVQIRLRGISEHLTPVLIKKEQQVAA